jgi:hypothetical protein
VPADDRTDLLPPVEYPSCQPGSSWQQLAEPAPLHERLRRASAALAQVTLIAVLSAVLLVVCWGAVIFCWAMWNAR